MISYDNYKNRIEKMAKVKHVLHKFRFLICGALALVVGVTVGLMCAKGSYTSGMSLSAQTVNFNEHYEVTAAKAFLAAPSEQRVEYSLEGSNEWTTKKPVKAGRYTARTVTKKIVGYSYSPSVSFDILPIDAEFTIASNSVVYGNTPEYKLTPLVPGHKVDESVLVFDYADYAAASTEVNAVESSLKIVDASGDDFTNCYNVTFSGKTLNVKNRNLIASPASQEFTYDGAGHSCKNEVSPDTLDNLAYGDTISIITSIYNMGAREDRVFNAGSYPVRIDSVRIMHGTTDVTARYNISLSSALLVINQRKMTITTQDGEKVYDGTPLVKTEVDAENLVSGHKVIADNSTLPDAENVGVYENRFGVTVLDGLTDVTPNYDVQINAGTLKITHCKLIATTPDDKKEYDGTPLTNYAFTLDTTPAGFDFTAVKDGNASITDFGTKTNEFWIIIKKKSDDSVVTHNFDIGYKFGTLEIEKRAMVVTTGSLGISGEVQYNGQEQSNATPESSYGLLEELGHELRVDNLCTVKDVNVSGGDIDNTTTYTVWDGGRNVSDNYKISYVYGKLRITPRSLTVTTNSPEPHVYDGTAFSDTGYTTDLEGGGLYNGDTLILEGAAAEITEVGREVNSNSYRAPSANYVISNTYHGWLEVVAKEVKVTISHGAAVYGGDIPENGFTLDCGELPNGETLTFTTRLERGGSVCEPETWEGYTLLNAGMYTIAANDDLAITGGNAHVTNYDFSFVDGILNITQREIYYVTADDEKVYDGTALSNTAYETYLASDNTKAGLLGGDKLSVRENPTSIVGAEERPNANYYSLPQFNNNYRIDQAMSTANFGTLKITPRPITVEISAIDEVTYGETFEYKDEAGNYANSPDLANGEKLKIAVIYKQNGVKVEPKDAGTYSAELDLENCTFYYADGTEIEGGVNNYTITCDTLENLKINEFLLVVKPLEFTNENGNALKYGDLPAFTYPDYIGNYDYMRSMNGYITELPYGEQLKITKIYYSSDNTFTFAPTMTDKVGTHRISMHDAEIYDKDGALLENGKSNYSGVENSDLAKFEIVPREIEVTVDDKTATYGEALPENTFTVSDGAMQYGEKLSLTYKYDRDVKDVGDYEIIADKAFIDGKEVDIENCNYSFTFVKGTLTVEASEITITVDSHSIVYGDNIPTNGFTVEGTVKSGDIITLDYAYYVFNEIRGDGLVVYEKGEAIETPKNNGKYGITANSVSVNGTQIDIGSAEENYNVTVVDGDLLISSKIIVVKISDISGVTYGDTWEYPDEAPVIMKGQLFYGETVELAVKYVAADGTEYVDEKPVNAGKYVITYDLENIKVYNSDGTLGVRENYAFSSVNTGIYPDRYDNDGLLTIARKDIVVKIEGQTCVYGDDLPENSFKIFDKDGVTELINGVDLPYGDELTLEYGYDKTPKDVGKYTISAKNVYVDGEEIIKDIAGNYNVDVKTATLEITKKVFHIRFSLDWSVSGVATRYGSRLSDLDYEEGRNYMDIATEERLELPYGEQLNVCLKILTKDGGEIEGIPNVGRYIERTIGFEVRGSDWKTLLESSDGLSLKNYEITCDDRTISIDPYVIKVTAEDSTCVYGDDIPEISYELDFAAEYTLEGVKQSVEFDFGYDREVKDAGEYTLQINGIKVYDENGKVIVGGEKNFEYTLVGGTLTITPKTVYAVVGDTSADYGGYRSIIYDFYLNAEGTGAKYQFPSDERCSVSCIYYEIDDPDKKMITPKNAGVYGVRVSGVYIGGMTVPAGEEDNVFAHKNYTIVGVDGTFTINKKRVTVVLNTIKSATYGETFTYAAGVDNYANADTLELAYGEKLEVAVEYLIDGEPGTPVNANYTPYNDRYTFAYSARLDEKACKVYESDGETVIENGADNYVFDCDNLEDLKILRRSVYIYLNDIENLPYGDEVKYPDEIGNYKRVEYKDGETRVEGVPYNEQFRIRVEYLDSNKDVVDNPKNVGTYKIKWKNAEVYDSDGALIEFGVNNYSFATAEAYQGTLEIVPREVKIVLNSYEKEYGEFKFGEYGSFAYPDGRDNYDVEKSDKLAFDEQISVEIKYQQSGADVSPKDAGLYNIVGVDYTVYDGENLADKENYRVSYEAGELEITQLELTINISKNMQCTYGEELPKINFYMADKRGAQLTVLPYSDYVLWVKGYYLKGDPETYVTPRNAGIYGITAKYCIINGVDSELESADGNYFITVEDGELNISKASISIVLDSLDDVYYGKKPEYATGANNYDTENSTKLAEGDELEVAVKFINYSALDYAGVEWICGEYVIELDEDNSLIHYNGETLPLLTNYEIAGVTAGNVTVAPRAVEVTFESREYVYGDGTAGNEKFSIAVDVSDDTDGTLSATELPYGETLSFENSYVKNGVTVNAHNAGVYGIREGKIYIDEREDGVGNYSFSFNTDATLTIKQKTVEITLDDMTRYYGDFCVLNEEGEYVVQLPDVGSTKQADPLANGEKLIVYIMFTEVGKEDATEFIEPKNVGNYSIVATGYTVISYESGVYEGGQESGAGDELTNYVINCEHGTLKILKRKLTVALSDELTSVYGAKLPEIKPIVTSDGADYSVLPYGESMQIAYHFVGTDGNTYYNGNLPQNVDGYDIILEEATINLGDGDGNYDITLVDGYLEITSRHIVVTVHGGSCTYGYEKLPELAFDITVNGNPYTLPYGEKLVPAYVFGLNGEWSALPRNAGVYEIAEDEENCSVTGGNGRYANYDVDYYFDGSLTIEQMALTVIIGSASTVYGNELPEIPYTVTSGGKECNELPDGDELKLDFTYASAEYEGAEPEAAGVYAISATASIEGGNARIENYSVTYASIEPGKQPVLTIAQREIEIVLNADGTVEFTYGTEFDGVICKADVAGAVEGQTINIAVTYAADNTESAAATYARRARFMTARATDGFMPKNVGKYVASLDLENCTVTDENGAVVGGINNYKLKDGFTCKDVKFEITPMELTVTVKDAEAVYGDKLPEIGYEVEETMPEGESLELTFSYASQPKHVGEYPIKLNSESIKGGEKSNYVISYANAAPKLTITEKAITVRVSDMSAPFDTDIVYTVAAGNYDKDNSDELVDGDTLKVTEVRFADGDGNEIGSRPNAGTYIIVFVDFEITNSDGEDAYGDYIVTRIDGTLTVKGNLIVIYTGSAEKEYDGTPLTCDEFTYTGTLAEGYEIVPAGGEQFGVTYVTAAGGADNKTVFKIVDKYGNDTDNYGITYGLDNKTYGKLTVTQRRIEIVSQSASREYNGAELTADHSLVYHGTTAGASAIADTDTFTPTTVSQTDVGSRPNTVTFTITDAEGNDVSANYAVTRHFGTLTVSKKSVNVTIKMGNAVYGEAPEISYETNVPLADGETLSFEVSYGDNHGHSVEPVTDGGYFILPAGDYRAYYVQNSAKIEGGREKAANYSFEFALGAQFSITKRHIIVITATPEAHEYDGIEFYNYTDYDTVWVVNGEKKDGDGLIGGDELTVVKFAKRSAVGSEDNICEYTATANYVIDDYEYGTLTVTKRSLAIRTEDITVTYDGKAHSDGTLIYNKFSLVEGHTIKVVGTIVEQTDYTAGIENRLEDKDIVIKDAEGNDVTANYAITWTCGTIIINKRGLDITTGSSVDTYDGKPHGNPVAAQIGGSLLTELNHEVKVLKEYTYTNATEGVDNTTKYQVVCGATDLSHNYNISYTPGKIVINKAAVTVTLKENVRAEYGSDYAELLSEGAVTLVNGETAELKIDFGTVDRLGTYTATVDWDNSVIKDSNGKIIENGADNYEVELDPTSRSFEVIARNISLTLNKGGATEFVYGSDYDTAITAVSASWSTSGEQIKVSVVYKQNNAECTPENVGTYTAELDGWTVEGGRKENYNVVSCNNVTFDITPKDLTVDMDDLEVVYGGELEYPDDECGYTDVDGLLDGHTLVKVTPAFPDGTPEFAGTYDIVCGTVTVTDENGNEVDAANYNVITGNHGTLTIKGVNIAIERKSVTKIYDGEKLELSANAPANEVTYYINGVEGAELEPGLRLVLDGEFATADGNVSSSKANEAKYKVVDEGGNVAGNYVVTYVENDAMLTIGQRELAVTTDDATRSYNGAPLTADCTYDASKLVGGHTLSIEKQARIVDVGSKPNDMNIVISDAAGNNVTANYNIDLTVGTLTVEKLTVEITIADRTRVYGENINVNNFMLEGELVNGETLNFRVLYKDGDSLLDGTAYLNVGEYGIVADKDNMAVIGGSGKLSNYDLQFSEGAKLKITERHIIVTTATPEAHEYDGNEFYYHTDYTTEWVVGEDRKGEDGLVGVDELTVVNYTKRSAVGSEDNICEYTASANYVIDGYEYGTLEVTERTISVSTADINGTYNGKPHSDETFTYEQSKLLEGHKIEVVDATAQTDATDGVDNVLEFKITDKDGNDVTDCYEILPEYGTIVIGKAGLTVTLNKNGNASFAYGDKSFDNAFKQFTTEGLVSGETLTVELVYNTDDGAAPVNAGEYTAELDLENSVITYAKGEGAGLDNYEISCEAVEFVITRKNITLTLGAWAAEEYDGGEHEYDTSKLSVPANALIPGESIAEVAVRYCDDTAGLSEVGAPVNAGTYYVFLDLDGTTVNGADGEVSLSTNYNVTCAYVTFTISPKKLTVTLSDVTHVYDGEKFDFAASDGFTTSLCEGDEIECNVTYSAEPVDADEYTVTFDTNIKFVEGDENNYVFDASASKLTCKLTITKRKITVTVADRDVEKGNENYTWEHLSSETEDGGEGFISSDIENNRLEVQFKYSDKSGKPEGAVEYKTVTAEFSGDAIGNYYITVEAGTLIVTERKVLVTPVYNGEPYVYDGNAVGIDKFGFTHVHNIEDCADDDKYGFEAEHVQEFIENATYTFTDKKSGNVITGTPVKAGTYVVSVEITSDSIKSYLPEYETAEFTIAQRPLSYTVAVDGDREYTYSGKCPDFEDNAMITAYLDNGVAAEAPEGVRFVLFDQNGNDVVRYNVGTYKAGITFEGIENYDITANYAQITIVPRVLVITPTDPYGGLAQVYNDTNLTLNEDSFIYRLGECADVDDITIVGSEFAPSASNTGKLTIAGVNIVDKESGDPVGFNYTVYSTYNATNPVIKGLGLSSGHFSVRVEYAKTNASYTVGNVFGEDDGTFPYTGKSFSYTFDGSQIYKELDYGHYITVIRNTVTVPAAADEYPDLILNLVRVYDADGKNVTGIYNLNCTNPAAAKITVTENVLSIDLSGVNVADLVSGGQLDCEVTGLYESASPAHTAEVYAYDVDGEWIVGAVVFSTNASGKKTDLSANYKLSESSVLSGATVKILTLDEAEMYSRDAIGVKIKVTAEQLAGGRGTVFTADSDGRWVLGNSYYEVDGTLKPGHELQVLVFADGDGYKLGVTVFTTENNRRKEAKNNYRLKDIVTTNVTAEYITVSAVSDLQRELYINFSGAFNEDGTPKIENGLLTGCEVKGLNTAENHVIEITATDNGNGTYSINVVVYQLKLQGASYKKFNKATSYKLVYAAPSQVVGASIVTGALS